MILSGKKIINTNNRIVSCFLSIFFWIKNTKKDTKPTIRIEYVIKLLIFVKKCKKLPKKYKNKKPKNPIKPKSLSLLVLFNKIYWDKNP